MEFYDETKHKISENEVLTKHTITFYSFSYKLKTLSLKTDPIYEASSKIIKKFQTFAQQDIVILFV